jgi:succinate dehydrogenase / fumarate reductase membrane anchor subunit
VLHGKKHWLYHRFSAILLLPLIFWLIYSLCLVPDITHENMILWLSNTTNYALLFILIVISVNHFQLGLQVILEDYISNIDSRNFYIKLLNIFYYVLAILGLISISIIYFGAII